MNKLEEFVKKAREIEGKATPGYYVSAMAESIGQNHIRDAKTGQLLAEVTCKDDAEFIAFSRNHLRTLLDIIERQEEALEFYRMGNGMESIECQRDVEKILGGECSAPSAGSVQKIDGDKMTTELTDKLSSVRNQEFQDGMRLASIEVYRHIKDMVDLGCVGQELSNYCAALIRLEMARLPKDIVR